jgi:O-antigen ligase
MAVKRSPPRKTSPASAVRGSAATPAETPWARWLLFAVVLVPPFVLLPAARDSFRLPKLVASEWLALASLLPLAWSWRRRPWDWRSWAKPGALAAAAPLVLLGLLSLATTAHPEHARRALPSLVIGAACLVGWTLGSSRAALERALSLLAIPACALALLAVLQFHGLYRPFVFATNQGAERLGVVSLAGNPGDLGVYLVLPCLLAQWLAWQARGGRRALHAGVAIVCLYGLVAGQTLTALAALVAGSAVLWFFLLPRRRALLGAAAVVVLAALAIGVLPPLRERAQSKVGPLLRGDWNELLTYRLDAWAAARWMLARHPATGVGFGAFRAEYTPAKEALLERGRRFSPFALESTFANAHNDILEVAAELGSPGLAALAWALFCLLRAALRRAPEERPGVVAGLVAMTIAALANFPFEIALVAFPWLVFLAWVMRPAPAAGELTS